MSVLYITLPQLAICFINVIGGLRFLKSNKKHQTSLLLIYIFCIIDFITGIISLLNRYHLVSFNIANFTYLFFIWTEIILLPAYISMVMGIKHTWSLPITLVFSTFIVSLFYIDIIISILQLVSGIYITIYCLIYLKWLFVDENIIERRNSIHFWIAMGIMVCYTASIPLCLGLTLLDFFGTTPTEGKFAVTLTWLFLIFNIIMHCFFIKAFSWKKVTQ